MLNFMKKKKVKEILYHIKYIGSFDSEKHNENQILDNWLLNLQTKSNEIIIKETRKEGEEVLVVYNRKFDKPDRYKHSPW